MVFQLSLNKLKQNKVSINNQTHNGVKHLLAVVVVYKNRFIMKNWNVNKNEMPLFDGEYLCWINEPQECGAIHEYYKVITCQNNIWLVGVLQFVKAWKELPLNPFDEQKEIDKLHETFKVLDCLVSDVGNLLSEHDIEWQQAGYYEHAKVLLKDIRNNNG